MANVTSLAGQDNILEEKITSKVIEQQEEAQDTVILANSDNSSSFIGIEEELDQITEAIRQEILQKQRNILREYIAQNLDATIDQYDDQEFSNYLKNINNRVIINQAFLDPKVKAELEKVEIEGYKKVHHNFADRFQTINWQDSEGQENIRIQVVKDNLGNQLAALKETTHKASEMVSLADGTTKSINSYRTIDFPTLLESNNGPMHLSLVVQDENGRNIAKDRAVYFTAHYDRQGKLIEISSPKPVKFNGEGNEAIGYIEHQGNIYTLPVNQGKYRDMMLALEKNKGQEINLSQISAPAQDQVVTLDVDLPRQQAKQHYHQQVQQSALAKLAKHYQLAKQQAELISQGLQLTQKHDSDDSRRLFEQMAADFQDIHGLSRDQAISQYQAILEKLQPAMSSRDQERESLQQLAQQNPTVAAEIIEEHLDTHAAEYKKIPSTNPIGKVLQWFKQILKVGSGNKQFPISSVAQQLPEVSSIKEKATKMAREVDQLIAQLEAANQSWYEELKKIQTLADNLPEADPNKEQLTTFVKLQLEEKESLTTGKPLAKSKERDQVLTRKADYEPKQKNQITNSNTAAIENIDQGQEINTNYYKTKTDQMIARLIDRDYPSVIIPTSTTPKVQTHKTQVNNR